MADWCSTALGFGGITHGDSDAKPIGSASSGINRKCKCTKDGLGGIAHRLAMAKPSMVPILVRNVGHQDDVVAPQLASVALPIGMAMMKPTATPMVMM
jgi:hypothetical protein